MEKHITYFEKAGSENTERVFELVDRAMAEMGIRKVIVASTRGRTAEFAMDRYKDKGVRLVILPHQFGFREQRAFPEEVEQRAAREGHVVYFGTMLFHTDGMYGNSMPTLIANYLRCFCQGFKVCVEMLLMAGNAGLVDVGEKVIVVSGTGRGADTALIMTGATSMNFRQMHISQILCKPL